MCSVTGLLSLTDSALHPGLAGKPNASTLGLVVPSVAPPGKYQR